MNPTANAFAIIKHFEGLRLTAYRCPAGVLTIGYGHTGKDVTACMQITEQRADQLLASDAQSFADAVNRLVKVPLTSGQFDALVSFAFNLGAQALAGSTLLRLVNASRFDAAAGEFGKWVHSQAAVLPGLVARRAAEAYLFQNSNVRF